MRISRALLVVWLSGFMSLGAAGGAYTLNQVMTELENREKSTTNIRFDFSQEINFALMSNKTKVAGEAVLGKSGKLRVTKRSPDNQVTVSDGKKIWVYNPAAKQVWTGSAKNWGAGSMLPKGLVPLNNYVDDLRKNFNLSLDAAGERPATEVLLLAEPKDRSLGYKLTLTLSTESWLPMKTVYISESAQVETFLSNHQVNSNVPDSIFKFSVPKGTDIIPLN